MNYLAHLHISDVTQTSATGNLLGDFVKGAVNTLPFDYKIKVGVQLHRKVDTFTDHHPYVKDLKSQLGEWRRYSGIILDVLFDYQIARNFQRYHVLPLKDFAEQIYLRLDCDDPNYSERFKRIVTGMKAGDWLTGYQELENIARALQGIGTRFKKTIPLHQALDWYASSGQILDQGFDDFYRELLQFSQLEAKKMQLALPQ